MRNIKLITYVMIILSQIIFNQSYYSQGRWGMRGNKIAELEKVKLIEVLDMDEETTLKFFSRRNTHMLAQKRLMARLDSLINQLDLRITEGDNNINYKNEINKILKAEEKISYERKKFFTSLDDILSDDQIAKLLVFEKKFRSEIRRQLIKHGRKGWKHRQNIN